MSANPNDTIESLAVGQIIDVDGESFIASLDSKVDDLTREFKGQKYTLGQFGTVVKVTLGAKSIYGRVARLRLRIEYEKERGIRSQAAKHELVAEVMAFGRGEWVPNKSASQSIWKSWSLEFKRGLNTFPLPSQKVYLVPKEELHYILSESKGSYVILGEHTGSSGVPCFADMNELIGKHTAILGTTGTGKSCTVAAVMHSLLERGELMKFERWAPMVIVLDPHNEYSASFKGAHRRLATDEGTLDLPMWMLTLDETIDLIMGHAENVTTAYVNIIKRSLSQVREDSAQLLGLSPTDITIDAPIPYNLEDFKASLESWRQTKNTEEARAPYNVVISNLMVLQRDSRLKFLTGDWDKTKDPIGRVLGQFIGEGPPVRVVDLSGIPDEVAGLVSGVIGRMLFSYKLWQGLKERGEDPMLLVCEEAHRYVPNAGQAQYSNAQQAIRRIAKEGRKYGIGLLLVTQRPSELEETVLSQCNSLVVLRVSNEKDLQFVRSILPDSMSELAKRIPELRNQEAVFVGQASLMPSRIMIRTLDNKDLPRSTNIDYNTGWQKGYADQKFIDSVVERWRKQKRSD